MRSKHFLATALAVGVVLSIGSANRASAEPQEGTGEAVGTGAGTTDGLADGTGTGLVEALIAGPVGPSPEQVEVEEILAELTTNQERIRELEGTDAR